MKVQSTLNYLLFSTGGNVPNHKEDQLTHCLGFLSLHISPLASVIITSLQHVLQINESLSVHFHLNIVSWVYQCEWPVPSSCPSCWPPLASG